MLKPFRLVKTVVNSFLLLRLPFLWKELWVHFHLATYSLLLSLRLHIATSWGFFLTLQCENWVQFLEVKATKLWVCHRFAGLHLSLTLMLVNLVPPAIPKVTIWVFLLVSNSSCSFPGKLTLVFEPLFAPVSPDFGMAVCPATSILMNIFSLHLLLLLLLLLLSLGYKWWLPSSLNIRAEIKSPTKFFVTLLCNYVTFYHIDSYKQLHSSVKKLFYQHKEVLV